MSVRLAQPPATPFAALNEWLLSLYQEIARLDAENRKLQRNLEVARDEKFILTDELGARYAVNINSVGPAVRITAL